MARAVIDASGTYESPNPLGANGLPAIGEASLSERIFYGIPDVLGRDRARYAGRRVLVVGSGHSAFNVLLDLAALAEDEPADTRSSGRSAGPTIDGLFGGGDKDQLEERGRLGPPHARSRAARRPRRSSGVSRSPGSKRRAAGIVASSDGQRARPRRRGHRHHRLPARRRHAARAAARARPDRREPGRPRARSSTRTCTAAAACLPTAPQELRQPEKDFYIVGMKSYGRAPTFLMLTGYEQVRSVVCALTGDWEGARDVQLVLPETGVCSLDAVAASGDGLLRPRR